MPDLAADLVKGPVAAERSERAVVLKRCHQCGGKFGLVRYYYMRHPFCSRACVERFKSPLAAEVSRRKTQVGCGGHEDDAAVRRRDGRHGGP